MQPGAKPPGGGQWVGDWESTTGCFHTADFRGGRTPCIRPFLEGLETSPTSTFVVASPKCQAIGVRVRGPTPPFGAVGPSHIA